MDNDEVKETLRRVLLNQLEACKRALSNDDVDRAKREIDGAITKLKRLMNSI